MAAMLALVCLTPPALMLAPPSSGTMLAIYAPGTSSSQALIAASSAGALAAEPIGTGLFVRAQMPAPSDRQSGAAALRARGAILVIAPISGWTCTPGLPVSRENRQ